MSTRISDNVALCTINGGGERLKKIIGLSLVTLLATAVMASAGTTNWTMAIKASDAAGKNFNSPVTLGCQSGATDGQDTAKGEPGTINAPGPNLTFATVATQIPGASKVGILDFKAPITGTETRSWDIHIYTMSNGGPTMDSILLTLTPGTGTGAPVYTFGSSAYTYTFSGSMVDGGTKTYSSTVAMPTSFTFTVANPKDSFATADILTLTVAPSAIPEPGSMLALGSGLIGLVGFGIRRRK